MHSNVDRHALHDNARRHQKRVAVRNWNSLPDVAAEAIKASEAVAVATEAVMAAESSASAAAVATASAEATIDKSLQEFRWHQLN